MLLEVNVLKNQILPFSIDSSSFKEIEETDVDLDFQSILQSIKKEKSVPEKKNMKNDEHSTHIEIDEEMDKYDEVLDKISHIVGQLLEIKSNYEELDNVDFTNILMELEELCQVIENIHNINEPIFYKVEEIESLINRIGQAKEIIQTNGIANGENINENTLVMEIENVMELIEERAIDALDLIDNRKGDIKKEEFLIIEENSSFSKNNHIQLDHSLEYKDLNLEDSKSEDYSEMESGIGFAEDSLMEDGEAQSTNIDSNYSFTLFAENKPATGNTIDVNFVQDYNREELIQQIVEKIEIKEGIDKQEVKIRLKPDYLGELILKMEVKEGSIQAKIVVDNYRAKEIIEAGLFQLKEQFEENGLDIKTFEVFVGTNEDFEREKRNGYTFRRNPARLKLGSKVEEEIRIYDSNLVRQREKVYYEGRLNLFV